MNQRTWRGSQALRHIVPGALVLVAALLPGCAHRARTLPDTAAVAASSGLPYGGFALGTDAQGAALIADVIAGPAALAGLAPGDRIDAVAGEKVGAARLLEILQASPPGTRLPLRVVRDGRVLPIEFVVGDRAQWAAPSASAARIAFVAPPARTTPVWLDGVAAKVAAAVPALDAERERMQRMFDDLVRKEGGFNNLLLNRQALVDPGTLIEWEHRLVADMHPGAAARDRLVPLLCAILNHDCAAIHRATATAGAPPALAQFARSIAAANRRVRDAFAAAGPRDRLFGDLRYLLEQTATKRTLIDQPDALKGIRAMQASMHVDFAALLDAFDRLIAAASQPPAAAAGMRRKIPAELAALVEGEILDYEQVDGGYVVIGGPGPNRYRMDRLYAVIDAGGDDQYVWGDGMAPETQIVIDVAGDDRYEARVGGPGAGWLGVAVLIDLAGNDTYASALGGCGAGAFGFGLLFDAAGADVYRCAAWSAGAGIYGAGILMDAGDGWDSYLSQSLSQGVGGAAGVGLLLDAGGDDLYRANGPVPSIYDTPTTFMSFSQGVGFGIRPYDHGGFGALIDFAGNDRYEGGEFSQGGGYYWGAGLLHDAGGDDFYYGGRYTQGFAAHQASGLFSDMAGDDVHWAMRAAAQGAAWDQSVAILYDGGGNDFYRAESLAQGAAAQQSRAWLFDAGGNDVYWSSGDTAQGVAGDNSYHYVAGDPVVSQGVLFDAGGDDRYSSGLANGQVRVRHDPGMPPNGSGNSGVAVDEGP